MPRHVWVVSRASKAQARSARGALDPRESKSFLDFSPHPAWLPERTARTVTHGDASLLCGGRLRHEVAAQSSECGHSCANLPPRKFLPRFMTSLIQWGQKPIKN